MDNSFFAYLQQLEMMAFFSGYPLFYMVILVLAGKKSGKSSFRDKLTALLPYAYALAGIFYLGMQLKNLYPDYSAENIRGAMQQPALTTWALLSLLFWIPFFSRKTWWSLLHSLVFFFFLARDLFLHLTRSGNDPHVIRNDMKIYTDSLLLLFICYILVLLISGLYQRMKKNQTD